MVAAPRDGEGEAVATSASTRARQMVVLHPSMCGFRTCGC